MLDTFVDFAIAIERRIAKVDVLLNVNDSNQDLSTVASNHSDAECANKYSK